MGNEIFIPEESYQVPVSGGSLTLYKYGAPPTGGRPILLIHGVTSSNRAWQLIARYLITKGYIPYAVDLRGRGRSNNLPGPFGMATHGADMKAVIDFIGVQSGGLQSIDVIGHSMGAFVAVALQGLYPESVSNLVLLDGGISLPLPPGMAVEQVMPFILGPALARLAMTFEDKEAYRNYWKPQPAFNRGWSSSMDEYADYDLQGEAPELRPSTNPLAVEEDSRDLFGTDLINSTLANLPKEVLMIRATRGLQNEGEGLYPMAVLNAVLPQYPKIELVTIEDTNHYDIALDDFGAHQVVDAYVKFANRFENRSENGDA
jgi:pimeloyl-ACP methyl ester carboxylesterase